MKNRILFDGIATQSTKNVNFHGGGEYAKIILRKALELNCLFDIVFFDDLIIDPEILNLIKANRQIEIFLLKNENEVYKLIKQKKYKIFYSALPYRYINYSNPETLFIMVIHGLRPVELPWDHYRYKYVDKLHKKIVYRLISYFSFIHKWKKQNHISDFRKLVQISNSKIITVSDHTKYSILYFFSFLNPQNIIVFNSPIKFPEKIDIIQNSGQYYLMISANRFEKNIYRAVKAFDSLFEKGFLDNKNVIIVGAKKTFYSWVKNKDRFIFKSYVSEIKLWTLFKNAYCFIYPSLNEGYGYPPLMAMWCSVPVVSSSITSIPEVCDNAALYFNPYCIEEIANRILQIEYNQELRKKLIQNGNKRVHEVINNQVINFNFFIKNLFQ